VPRLSIVIPVLGNLKRLEDTLVSVLENRPADCQVIVALSRPYDDPYDLKDEVCFVEAGNKATWGECVECGVRASKADVVHLLTSGVEVSPGWADIVLPHFANPEIAAVAPLVHGWRDPDSVISAGMVYYGGGTVRRIGGKRPSWSLKPESRGLYATDTLASFYRKSALAKAGVEVGSLGESFAGVHVAMALRQAGLRCVAEPKCHVYADAQLAAARSALREGFEAERLFRRWAPATGRLNVLAAHAALVAAELLSCPVHPSNVCRLTGRLLGVMDN
jgi:hypothetical protein